MWLIFWTMPIKYHTWYMSLLFINWFQMESFKRHSKTLQSCQFTHLVSEVAKMRFGLNMEAIKFHQKQGHFLFSIWDLRFKSCLPSFHDFRKSWGSAVKKCASCLWKRVPWGLGAWCENRWFRSKSERSVRQISRPINDRQVSVLHKEPSKKVCVRTCPHHTKWTGGHFFHFCPQLNVHEWYSGAIQKVTSQQKWPFPVTVKTIEFAIWNNGHRFCWPPSLPSLVTSFLNGP